MPGIVRNPAREVRYLKAKGDGFHTWTLEEVEQYEKRHPVGTMARLALAVLLYTMQRRSDVVTFGDHLTVQMAVYDQEGNALRDADGKEVIEEWLRFTQFKGRNKSEPVKLELMVLAELRRILDATPGKGKTWITSSYGRPYTAESFGNQFHDWCVDAGVPGRAHGPERRGLPASQSSAQPTARSWPLVVTPR